MKLLSDVCLNFLDSIKCSENQVIESVLYHGRQVFLPEPTLACNMSCPVCKETKGYFVPYQKGWSCCNPDCAIPIHHPSDVFSPPIPEKPKHSFVDKCVQPKQLIEACNTFVKIGKGFLVLSGTNGTGKSFITEAMFKDFRCERDEKKFVNLVDLKELWLTDLEKWNSSLHLSKQYSEYKLLILDDLGIRFPSDAFNELLYSIVDKRYRNKNATIITTNMESSKIREVFGDAFLSRVGSGRVHLFEGKDRRLPNWEMDPVCRKLIKEMQERTK